MIVAQERIPHWILISVFAIAAEALMNNGGYVSGTSRSMGEQFQLPLHHVHAMPHCRMVSR
jgi:hypothetical protein